MGETAIRRRGKGSCKKKDGGKQVLRTGRGGKEGGMVEGKLGW